MRKSFEYLYTVKAEDNLDIEDIGNTCIACYNDLGYVWFLIIETTLGRTEIKQFGPFHVDFDIFSYGFNFNYQVMDYKESKICNIIDKFLNDNHKVITQAEIFDKQVAYQKLKQINFEEMR